MHGYAYDFLAILHAVTVIFTLLWLPFGKLFHIFMRPAHLAVGAYKDAGREGEPAHCRRCHAVFASRMHVEDLIAVEAAARLSLRDRRHASGTLPVDLPALPPSRSSAGRTRTCGPDRDESAPMLRCESSQSLLS